MEQQMSLSKWAIVRRNELTDVPVEIHIHKDFLDYLSEESIYNTFNEIHEMFYLLYTKMAENPAYFNMPTNLVGEFDYFSKEEREIRKKPLDPFLFMLQMFSSGKLNHGVIEITIPEWKANCKVKNIPTYIQVLSDIGFQFEGTSNGKAIKGVKSIHWMELSNA